jgi:hypothetical protein
MAYAIIQKELVAPSPEQLQRAFTALPGLTGLDAQTAANDAYGILMRGLDLEKASTLQDALFKESVETEVVSESELPAMPPARLVREADFQPGHLTLHDPLRRASTLTPPDVSFLAAGMVRTRAVTAKEETAFHLMLEVFLRDGSHRYSFEAGQFAYDCLGGEMSDDPLLNFVKLVQALARFAPHAGQNQGACRACQADPELLAYPSKAAFFEEMTWMLWRIGKLTSVQGAGI